MLGRTLPCVRGLCIEGTAKGHGQKRRLSSPFVVGKDRGSTKKQFFTCVSRVYEESVLADRSILGEDLLHNQVYTNLEIPSLF